MTFFQPLDKTHEEKLIDHANNTVNEMKVLKDGLVNQIKTIFDMIWNNPDFTPQEVIDQLGDKAIPMFTFSAQLQTIIKSADPDYQRLVPQYQYSIVDGQIVVGDLIE